MDFLNYLNFDLIMGLYLKDEEQLLHIFLYQLIMFVFILFFYFFSDFL